MSSSLTTLLETPYAQHVCDFEHTISHQVKYNPDGSIHYAFGHGFLELAQLTQPETLYKFGIDTIWFARYFQRQAQLPTLRIGEVREIPQSQLRLAFQLLPNASWTPTQEEALKKHVFQHFPVTEEAVDAVVFETEKQCCHSPCFGCMRFDFEKAIETQGRTPWLAILEAKHHLKEKA
jgi:hypothetical protein